MRINKYLAQSGIASRRKCEELVTSGQVKVNNIVIRDLATIINDTDKVTVNDRPVKPVEDFIYIIMNKPKGVLTTCQDERGRKTILDLLDQETLKGKRVFPVGRLDYNTSGLLILTNDGDYARHLTHPSTKIKKTYVATLDQNIDYKDLVKLETGIEIDGERTHPARARIINTPVKQNNKQLTQSQVLVQNKLIHNSIAKPQSGHMSFADLESQKHTLASQHAQLTTSGYTSNKTTSSSSHRSNKDTNTAPDPATQSSSSTVEITITQGRNRQVRRMFETLGYKVTSLKRTSIGNLKIGNLRPREYRTQSTPPNV